MKLRECEEKSEKHLVEHMFDCSFFFLSLDMDKIARCLIRQTTVSLFSLFTEIISVMCAFKYVESQLFNIGNYVLNHSKSN